MTFPPGPYKCWQAQSLSQALLSGTKELLPKLIWAGSGKKGASQAQGGFSQLIILGKARYKFHGWNARVVKCWKKPQRGPRTLLPGRQWVEGWPGLVERSRLLRGVCLSGTQEIGLKEERKKSLTSDSEVVEGPEIGLVLFLNMKKTRLCVKKWF